MSSHRGKKPVHQSKKPTQPSPKVSEIRLNLVAEMLTPLEIEELRKDAKESSEYFDKAFERSAK